ncbi:phosphodiesterase YaeI [Escherichia coli]|uniref:Phosphodiesterase YaeI n=1 Tax=Escherichia coli TaxID=562 RepID=A0A377CW54_ECOLX|nr:phosphodiesterase YaeI [Escherichia coli]
MISRRRFLQATAATIATSSGFGYMHYCEPGWFELIRHRLAFFKDNAAPFKILFWPISITLVCSFKPDF